MDEGLRRVHGNRCSANPDRFARCAMGKCRQARKNGLRYRPESTIASPDQEQPQHISSHRLGATGIISLAAVHGEPIPGVGVLESGWLTSVENDHNAGYSRQWRTVAQVVLTCRAVSVLSGAAGHQPDTSHRSDRWHGRPRLVAIRLSARASAPRAGLASSEQKRAVSARASSAIAGCATKAFSMSEQVMKSARFNKAIK
jgi:hypothetical protein